MNDLISELTEREKQTIFECLHAAEQEVFFPKWEFETLFGITRDQFSLIRENFASNDKPHQDLADAIANAMNHLLGYPNLAEELWGKYITVSPAAVKVTLDKLLDLGL